MIFPNSTVLTVLDWLARRLGMQAALLSGSVVGEGSIIGAGAVVREGMEIPPRSLAVGVPAKVIGTVDPEKIAEAEAHARDYYESALRNARSA